MYQRPSCSSSSSSSSILLLQTVCVCVYGQLKERRRPNGAAPTFTSSVCVEREQRTCTQQTPFSRAAGEKLLDSRSLSLFPFDCGCVCLCLHNILCVCRSSIRASSSPTSHTVHWRGWVDVYILRFPPYDCVCLKKPFVSECCCLCSFFLFCSILLHGVLSKGKRVPPGVSCVCGLCLSSCSSSSSSCVIRGRNQ